MFESWPFTNFHDMNLDWIVGRIKNVEDAEASAKESASAAAESREEAATSAEAAANSANSAAVSALQLEGVAEQVVVNTSRIDNLVANAGDTDNNAELLDIRVDYEGYTYDTAGAAVRAQAERRYKQSFTTQPGYFDSTGRRTPPSNQQEVYTNKIQVEPGETLVIDLAYSAQVNAWAAYCLYDSDSLIVGTRQVIQSDSLLTSKRYTVTIPSGVQYIALTYRSYGENAVTISRYKEPDNPYTIPISLETPQAGYYDGAGTGINSATSSNELYTLPVRVVAGEKIRIHLALDYNNVTLTNYVMAVWFGKDGKTPITNRVTLMNTFTTEFITDVTVPENAYYLGLAWRDFSGNNTLNLRRTVNTALDLANEEPNMVKVTERPVTEALGYYVNDGTYYESTNAYSKIYNVENVETIHAYLPGDYGSTCAISFFTDLTPTPDSFMAGENITFRPSTMNTGWWYHKDVPDGARSATVTFVRSAGFGDVYVDMRDADNAMVKPEKVFPFTFDKYYYHGLTNHITDGTNTDIVIPAQSVYDIDVAKRLGFKFIEANIMVTATAGKWLVGHTNNGKLGNDVKRLDGQANSTNNVWNIPFNILRTEYVYRSIYPKYRTPITSFDEFMTQCKKLEIYPVMDARYESIVNAAKKYLGDKFVLYTYDAPSMRQIFDGFIMEYRTDDDIAAVLDRCETIGKPYMYCLSNPSEWSDTDLKTLTDTLHRNGFYIGFAGNYMDPDDCNHLMGLGFDFASSGGTVNPFESGNVFNINCQNDFDELTTTGTVSNGALTLTSGQTITLSKADRKLYKYYIDLNMSGTLEVVRPAFDEYSAYKTDSYMSTGDTNTIISGTVFFDELNITLRATSTTTIKNISIKVSDC